MSLCAHTGLLASEAICPECPLVPAISPDRYAITQDFLSCRSMRHMGRMWLKGEAAPEVPPSMPRSIANILRRPHCAFALSCTEKTLCRCFTHRIFAGDPEIMDAATELAQWRDA